MNELVFTELYNKYYYYIFRAQLNMCGEADLAEDLTQETFVNIFRFLDSFDPEKGEFKSWANRIAANIFRKHRAKKSEHIASTDSEGILEFVPDQTELHSERTHRKMEKEHLLEVVDELPEPERSIILLKFFEKKTVKATAQALNISESTVYRHYLKAMQSLEEKLTELEFQF